MIIDNELITYLEELSRLKLDEEEKEKAKESLSKIIGYIDVLSKLDTENEKEMSHTFEFSNAVIAKKFDIAFDLLDKLIASGIDGFALTGILASSYTNMFMVRDAVSHGLSDDEIAKKLGYSGTGRVYVMKKNSKIYTIDELKEIIISLSKLDVKLKTGYNPVYGIKEFLLSL